MTAPGAIYVVDDEPEVRKGLERLLRAAGWEVRAFFSADEFLSALQAAPPRCVILDYHMPGVNGLELQDLMVARGSTVPVVYLSGSLDIADLSHPAFRQAEFLVKPAQREHLLAAVERAIAR